MINFTSDQDIEKLKEEIEKLKQELQLADRVIKNVEAENKAMSESEVYADLLYFVANDITTANSLVCYDLEEDTTAMMTKQHHNKSGPIYDVKISSQSSFVKFDFLNLSENSQFRDQFPSLQEMFEDLDN